MLGHKARLARRATGKLFLGAATYCGTAQRIAARHSATQRDAARRAAHLGAAHHSTARHPLQAGSALG